MTDVDAARYIDQTRVHVYFLEGTLSKLTLILFPGVFLQLIFKAINQSWF